jgi:hypothetical protein
LSPADADSLPDLTWDAMVRRMVKEADAIEKANADTARLRR